MHTCKGQVRLPLPHCAGEQCRTACPPPLASALRGVTHLRLFLCGDAVRPGLPVDGLARQAAVFGASLVLPSGQGLALASKPAPAVPL